MQIKEGQTKGRSCEECGSHIWDLVGYPKDGHQRVRCSVCKNEKYPQKPWDKPLEATSIVAVIFMCIIMIVAAIVISPFIYFMPKEQ